MYVGVLCVSVGVCVWVEIVDCVSNALPDRCHRWAALNGGNAAKRIGERKKEKVNGGLPSVSLFLHSWHKAHTLCEIIWQL